MEARRAWPKEGIARVPYWIYSDPEISARVDCGLRNVRREFASIRKSWLREEAS